VASDLTLKTVETFARELVRLGHLTEFQAAEVCRGKADQLMLGDYLLIDEIGHGGMGQVFRARHGMMNREVAVKLMRPDAMDSFERIQRFRREVAAAAQLTHPNVVSAYDAGEFAGHYFLVMEYVRGQDLRRRVRQSGPLPLPLALNYVLQAAEGLEYAHKRGVIHRDVKPGNLLVADDGTVKVLDLGLSLYSRQLTQPPDGAAAETDLTATGEVMGTVDFMAPEQALNAHDVDARCDIYSLGCTLHYLLTGLPPYLGETVMSRLVAHRENPIPRLGSIVAKLPHRLDTVFQRMLAKKPADRFQSMSELITNLRLCLMDLTSDRDIPETVQITRTTPHRRRSANWLGVGGPWERAAAPAVPASPSTTKPPPSAPFGEDAAANVPAVDWTRPFNPLDRVDLSKNVVSGVGWKREGHSLWTAAGPAIVQLPGELPSEYEFRFMATRRAAAGPLIIGLRFGDHQCYVLLDAARNTGDRITGLGTDREGKLVHVCKGITLESDTPTPVACRVSASSIDVIVGTETAIHWQGSASDLRLGGGWRVPDKRALFLGTNDKAVFELSDLQVKPLPPLGAPAAP
jgi:serine/threonine protein kinase